MDRKKPCLIRLKGYQKWKSISGYQRAGQILYEKAVRAHQATGEVWPIFGICNGFEMLAHFSNNFTDPLTRCNSTSVHF